MGSVRLPWRHSDLPSPRRPDSLSSPENGTGLRDVCTTFANRQRTIHHEARGSRVLLFVWVQRRQGTVTEPFVCLGFARYVSHEAERP